MAITTNIPDSRRLAMAMGELFANMGPAKNPPVEAAAPPGAFAMEPLTAYRCGDSKEGWVFCMYRDEEDRQQAFNEVVSAFPAGMEPEVREWRPGQRIDFVALAASPTSADPLGQQGYIGAKWK